jgi:hypothetical protein
MSKVIQHEDDYVFLSKPPHIVLTEHRGDLFYLREKGELGWKTLGEFLCRNHELVLKDRNLVYNLFDLAKYGIKGMDA